MPLACDLWCRVVKRSQTRSPGLQSQIKLQLNSHIDWQQLFSVQQQAKQWRNWASATVSARHIAKKLFTDVFTLLQWQHLTAVRRRHTGDAFSIAQFQHSSLQLGLGCFPNSPGWTWAELSKQGGFKIPWHHVLLPVCIATIPFLCHTSHICVSWQLRAAASWETWHTFLLRVSLSNSLCNFSCITTHLVVWPFAASTSQMIEIASYFFLWQVIKSISFGNSRSNESSCIANQWLDVTFDRLDHERQARGSHWIYYMHFVFMPIH